LKHVRPGASSPDLVGDCEEFRLLKLKGEYISFILDLESEAALLGHVLTCRRCRDYVRRLIESGIGRDDRWGSLFSGELQDLLGEEGGTFPGRTGDCPKRVDYADVDDFIGDRILWRKKRLDEIRSDAEAELKDLMARLEENMKNRC